MATEVSFSRQSTTGNPLGIGHNALMIFDLLTNLLTRDYAADKLFTQLWLLAKEM